MIFRMRAAVFLAVMSFSLSSYGSAKVSDQQVHRWSYDYVKIHNQSSTLASLFKATKLDLNIVKIFSKKQLQTRTSRVQYLEKSKTFLFKNGDKLKIVSIPEQIYELNGKAVHWPSGFHKSAKAFRGACFSFFLPQAFADSDCDFDKGNPILDFEMAQMGRLFAADMTYHYSRFVGWVSRPKCEKQMDEIVRLVKESQTGIYDLYCDQSYAPPRLKFSLTSPTRVIRNNPLLGLSEVDSPNDQVIRDEGDPLPQVFYHGRLNDAYKVKFYSYESKKNTVEPGAGAKILGSYTCKAKHQNYKRLREKFDPYLKVSRYIAENLFCAKCGYRDSPHSLALNKRLRAQAQGGNEDKNSKD